VLSDADGIARKAYGVGRAFFGLADGRETFFIDAKGIVRGQFEKALGFA
jgi:peroxiredoxin Q/BCP